MYFVLLLLEQPPLVEMCVTVTARWGLRPELLVGAIAATNTSTCPFLKIDMRYEDYRYRENMSDMT